MVHLRQERKREENVTTVREVSKKKLVESGDDTKEEKDIFGVSKDDESRGSICND